MYVTCILLFFLIQEHATVQLLMSITKGIKTFQDSNTADVTSLTSSTHHAIAVDYHLARGEFYYTDSTGRIYRNRLSVHELTEEPTIIAEIQMSDGIAVDWVHDNLYWTDISRQTLEVATLDGLNRRILLNATNGLDKPRAIALDPSNGLLFWSDWGGNARIESSGLDGKKIRTVTSSHLIWPNGLTIDLPNSKLYILDGFVSTISSCNYDGSELRVLFRSKNHILQAFGLTFDADTVYWDSWRTRTLYKMNTINKKMETLLQSTGLSGVTERMMGLKAVHATLQPKLPTRDPCKTATCSHFCLVSRDLTASCSCPFGYQLSSDNETCAETGYLLVCMKNAIRRYNLEGNEEECMTNNTKTAIAIGYHLQKGLVFWSDVVDHKIYRAPLEQMNNKTVVAHPETCDGLAVDWIHDVLYWTDTKRNTLEAARLDGSKHMILFNTDLDEPRDLALDPFTGLMFWTDWGVKPRVERSTLDGLERTIIHGGNIVWPNGITIDLPMKRIYYVDGKLGRIYSSLYDGSDMQIIYAPSSPRPLQLFSIALFNDKLYWTDWQSRSLYRSPKYNTTDVTKRIISTLHSKRAVNLNGVEVVHSSLQKAKHNPCAAARCRSLCLGTTTHTAHCMGEESVPIAPSVQPSVQPSDQPELIKTASNDSFDISLSKTTTPPLVLVSVKCLGRVGCEEDARCDNQSPVSYVFSNEMSFHIADLLPGSHYEINFVSAKHDEVFNITTSLTEPPEVPKNISVEIYENEVVVKWDPVDSCVPGFNFYNFKLYQTSVENNIKGMGNTNLTEVVFNNLEPEVNYTIKVYTNNPEHYSSVTFSLHRDAPQECDDPDLMCNGHDECPDGSDEDLNICAGIVNVTIYKKSASDVYLRVDVTNGTKNLLERFVGSYSKESGVSEQFERAVESCFLWPHSYCFHISPLEHNITYDFKISAAIKGGKVGNEFSVSAITKEEVPGPPADVCVIKHNSTCLEFQWHHPIHSSGKITNFFIVIEEIGTYYKSRHYSYFPIKEVPAPEEEPLYKSEMTELSPASSYAVSIAAKNAFVGTPATIIANTPPPPMEVIRMLRVEVANSMPPLSWRPGAELGELPEYHELIRSYMLLLLPSTNEHRNGTGDYSNEAIKNLLKSKFGDRFVVFWEKNVEEMDGFQSPIKVGNLKTRNQYKLAWVQVSQYKDSYSIDVMESYIFRAI